VPEILEKLALLETSLLQIKILAILYEKSSSEMKNKIKKILLQKIIFLVNKIGVGPSGNLKSMVVEYKPGLDEIDIDRTLEEEPMNNTVKYESIYCYEKIKQKGSYILMLDISNSMYQEKIAVAAIATGVFARKLKDELHGVLVFSRDVKIIKKFNEPNILPNLVDRMLEVQTGGATNIRLAIQKGYEMLCSSRTSQKIGILVTDGWATIGGDPVEVAKRFDRLHVLGISFGRGGSDPVLNAKMARAGKGKYMHVKNFDDLPLAIAKILRNK